MRAVSRPLYHVIDQRTLKNQHQPVQGTNLLIMPTKELAAKDLKKRSTRSILGSAPLLSEISQSGLTSNTNFTYRY